MVKHVAKSDGAGFASPLRSESGDGFRGSWRRDGGMDGKGFRRGYVRMRADILTRRMPRNGFHATGNEVAMP